MNQVGDLKTTIISNFIARQGMEGSAYTPSVTHESLRADILPDVDLAPELITRNSRSLLDDIDGGLDRVGGLAGRAKGRALDSDGGKLGLLHSTMLSTDGGGSSQGSDESCRARAGLDDSLEGKHLVVIALNVQVDLKNQARRGDWERRGRRACHRCGRSGLEEGKEHQRIFWQRAFVVFSPTSDSLIWPKQAQWESTGAGKLLPKETRT